MISYTEYAVEVNDINTLKFIRQVDVFNTFEDAEKYVDNNTGILNENEFYNIIYINYNENGDEVGFGSAI